MFVISAVMFSSCSSGNNDIDLADESDGIDYSQFSGITLNVYNWGEYISDGTDDSVDINKVFEEKYNIHINYTNYSTNEDLYSKLKSGASSYDIIVPSDYMVEQLIAENLIQKLDFSHIPNYKYIDDEFKNMYYDPKNEYSVPYNCGMVGVIYNTELVDYTPDSWDILWDENLKDQILMINNPRDAFGIAQFKLNIDINTTNYDELKLAQEALIEQKKYVKAYVMDEVYNKMESGAAAVAPYYAGDFLSMYENNDKLAFVYPKEGTNIFVDALCIPTSAEHKEAAELYINFLCDPNIAVENAEKICYRSPNKAVLENEEYLEFLEDLHPDAYDILYPDLSELYPDRDVKKFYFRKLPDETLKNMNDLWDEIKMTRSGGAVLLLIICAVFVVVIACIIVYFKIRKKKRQAEE